MRAVFSAWIPDWKSGAVVGVIAAAIGIAGWRSHRETRTERAAFERYLIERDKDLE